jgi:outer membrane immunogenic protein
MRLRIASMIAVTAAVVSTSAMAADLPAKAPPYIPPAPVWNWSGFYIGGHIGAAFGGNDSFNTDAFGITTGNRDAAFLGGGQIGADYQFGSNWVIGIEGQISGLSNSDRTFTDGVGTLRDRSDWLASVTGRLGYTWGPGLIYAKGGVGFRDNSGFTMVTPFLDPNFRVDRNDTGYTVGGGFEYMFAPNWSAKVEYQYFNFDNTNVSTVGFNSGTFVNFRDDFHTVKVGLNYRFNWGSPVLARY